jgi:hypothetical protein
MLKPARFLCFPAFPLHSNFAADHLHKKVKIGCDYDGSQAGQPAKNKAGCEPSAVRCVRIITTKSTVKSSLPQRLAAFSISGGEIM